MTIEEKNPRNVVAGRRGGIARREALTPEQRQQIASAAAAARWARPTPKQTVDKMVMEIYQKRQKMALYRRDGALWFVPDGHANMARWREYLVGVYDVGVVEDDVMADVAEQ